MLETAHHQADCCGHAQEDDGETDEHRHLDVHPQHAVYVSEGAAGLATAHRVLRRVFSSGALEIFLSRVEFFPPFESHMNKEILSLSLF